MLAIQMRRLCGAQKKLRSIGIGPSVSHRKCTGAIVGQNKVLIGKFYTTRKARKAASTIVCHEVATLAHEVFNDAMKFGALWKGWVERIKLKERHSD